jgi:cellulose synthase/poly-beta-1,6-N-acetylglucosamine synthase-like glycosyltransferase
MVAMRYRHETWVLDEGDDDRVKKMSKRLGVAHFSRKNMPEYQASSGPFKSKTKYGNVNAWLHEVGFDRYDIIVSFDPDHVPTSSFIDRVLGYFDDPEVGYVQAAQVYYNQAASFIARGAAEETYAYYSSLQMASSSLGYPIVTGCHNSHRVEALREIGGFAAHDADDLLITLGYRAAGWKGHYVPEILAKGLTPVDWAGYLPQQRRWARSVVDIKLRIYPTEAGRLPWRTRFISFLHGISYLQEGFSVFLGLLFLVWQLAVGTSPVLSSLFAPQFLLACGLLWVAEFYRQRFFLDPRSEWGLHWRAGVLRYAKWPQVLHAAFDVVRGFRPEYVLTPKERSKRRPYRLLSTHVVVAVVLGASAAFGLARGAPLSPVLHTWAVALIAVSLALVATQYTRFPDPFDRNLLIAECKWAGMSPPNSTDSSQIDEASR